MRGRPRQVLLSQAGLAGFRFPPEVIVVAVHSMTLSLGRNKIDLQAIDLGWRRNLAEQKACG